MSLRQRLHQFRNRDTYGKITKSPFGGSFSWNAIVSFGFDVAQNLNFNLAVDTNTAVSSINQFFNTFDQGAARAKNQLNSAFGQNLQTSVEINLKNGELVAKKIQNVNQESKRLAVAADAINGKWGKTPNVLKRQIATLKQLQGDTAKYSQKTGYVSKDWKLVTNRIREANKELKKMTVGGTFKQLQSGLTGVIGKFTLVQTLANTATSAVMGLVRGVTDFAGTAAEMEVLNLQLEVFTGSAEGAEKAFGEFVEIAAKTPFDLKQVAQASKTMMAFGMTSSEAATATEQLSIVAAATGGDLNNLARNLGQIQAQGQAYTRDLTQFAIQGIPIWEQMSMVTGKTTSELKKMASEGQISFDIVSAAITNMTAEGTDMATMAERMQETFTGRLAAIAAAFQLLALKAVQAFNLMDKALGNVISNSMKAFAQGVRSLANNLEGLIPVIGGVATAIGIMLAAMAVAKIVTIVQTLGGLVGVYKSIKTAIAGAAAAKATLMALLNPATIGISIAAVAAGVGVYAALTKGIEEAKQETENLENKTIEGAETIENISQDRIESLANESEAFKEYLTLYEDQKRLAGEAKAALDAELAVLEAMKDNIKDRYDAEITAIDQTITELEAKADLEKSQHDDRMSELEEQYEEKVRILDMENDRLRAKTADEKKLYQFNKKALIDKINSGKLDEEALLRAKARLSRMTRQEQIDKNLVEKARLKKQYEEASGKEVDRYNKAKAATNKAIDAEKLKRDDIIRQRDDEIQKIKDVTAAVTQTNAEVQAGSRDLNTQISIVQNLKSAYSDAADEAERMSKALADAARQRAARPGGTTQGTGTVGTRASGGPVSGGSKYTVNELGKEAFLSASGKLSMINAPSWGAWRAPSDGTVIPAHLTKQLDMPTGGINLNSGARLNAARAGASGGGYKALINALGGMSGDRINNSVTIQSANPTQTAGDMLVRLNRARRRR